MSEPLKYLPNEPAINHDRQPVRPHNEPPKITRRQILGGSAALIMNAAFPGYSNATRAAAGLGPRAIIASTLDQKKFEAFFLKPKYRGLVSWIMASQHFDAPETAAAFSRDLGIYGQRLVARPPSLHTITEFLEHPVFQKSSFRTPVIGGRSTAQAAADLYRVAHLKPAEMTELIEQRVRAKAASSGLPTFADMASARKAGGYPAADEPQMRWSVAAGSNSGEWRERASAEARVVTLPSR